MIQELLAQVRSSWLDEGVQLCEERNGPHQVAADEGEDERGPPESTEGGQYTSVSSIRLKGMEYWGTYT